MYFLQTLSSLLAYPTVYVLHSFHNNRNMLFSECGKSIQTQESKNSRLVLLLSNQVHLQTSPTQDPPKIPMTKTTTPPTPSFPRPRTFLRRRSHRRRSHRRRRRRRNKSIPPLPPIPPPRHSPPSPPNSPARPPASSPAQIASVEFVEGQGTQGAEDES